MSTVCNLWDITKKQWQSTMLVWLDRKITVHTNQCFWKTQKISACWLIRLNPLLKHFTSQVNTTSIKFVINYLLQYVHREWCLSHHTTRQQFLETCSSNSHNLTEKHRITVQVWPKVVQNVKNIVGYKVTETFTLIQCRTMQWGKFIRRNWLLSSSSHSTPGMKTSMKKRQELIFGTL